MTKLGSVLVLLAGVAAAPSLAAGFHLDVQSGRATGMAAAVTADSNDASAVFFNPAMIVQEDKKYSAQIGDTLIIPAIKFTPTVGNSATVTNLIPPAQVYATYALAPNLAVGLGVFEPFGNRITWPDDFVGRTIIKHVELATYYLNPEIAYACKVSMMGINLKVGVGLQIIRGTVDLTRAITFPGSEGEVELGAGTWGFGGNLGLLAELPGFAAIGLAYRSRAQLNFDGKAHFSNVPTEFQGSANGQIHDQTVSTSVTLPDELALGISVRPLHKLKVNFDTVYFTWQSFTALTIDFQDPTLSQSERKNWHHTWNYHAGAEYEVMQDVRVRAGIMYDPTPSPADTLGPDVPDANRVNVALGVGYHWKDFDVDLGYQAVIFVATPSTLSVLPGTYSGVVNLLNLSISFAKPR